MILEIKSLNISEKKGTIKTPVSTVELNDSGLVGDAHAGQWHRQVSLLGIESIEKFTREQGREVYYGEFAENITTCGGPIYEMKPFDRLTGEQVILEVTQIGKKCHGKKCTVFRETGDCIMPTEGIFARVVQGGKLTVGENLIYNQKTFRALVITLSDRAYRKEYEDQSGPVISRLLGDFFKKENRLIESKYTIIPDETGALIQLLTEARDNGVDLVFTSGGTGIGPRDITPETVKSVIDKEIPGIMEMIRLKYGIEKPGVLLSRSIAGVMDKTLLFTLPGSPKAVAEYCAEIFPILNHAFLMIKGIDNH